MIDDSLALFNRDGVLYGKLIHDKNRAEFPEITNINDINSGAVYNALTWHERVIQRIGEEFSLSQATGVLLKYWGSFWNVPKPAGMSDGAYRSFLLGKVLSIATTIPVIQNIFSTNVLKESKRIGPYLNNSYLGVGPRVSGVAGCTPTFARNVIYVIFSDEASYDPTEARAAQLVKAAGMGVFQSIRVDT